MSDGMSWTRPPPQTSGQAAPAPFGQNSAPQSFGMSGSAFGNQLSAQPPNEFQRARTQNQSQNWFQSPSIGTQWPTSNGTAGQSPGSAFAAFPPQSQPQQPQQPQFAPSPLAAPGAPFAQPQSASFASARTPPFGQENQQAPRPNHQFQNHQFPQSQAQPAFTTVRSTMAPQGAFGQASTIPPRKENSKKQSEAKRPNRKDASETGSRGRSEPVRNQAKGAVSAATEFPRFAPTAFTSRAHPRSNDLAILKPLPKPLTAIQETRDPWDTENQRRLEQIEREYIGGSRSLQEAYDVMTGMREKERSEMEKRNLVDSAQTRKSLDDAIVFVGSCTDMCPVYERVRRALENNAIGLEKDAGGKVVAARAVKAFARPAAGNPPALPSDVRPPSTLVRTLRHLVTEVLPKLPDTHPFLWDRTRAIRQDFTFQNFQGPEAMWCLEVIARIHVVCLHKMAHAASLGAEWSQQQELEQFNKCLQSLSEFYEEAPTDNEAEMRAYAILSHLFDEELVATVDRLPLQVSRHPLIVLACELRTLAFTSVTEFFERVRRPDVPAIFRAILEIHFNQLRIRGVRNLVSSLHRRTNMYPLKRFVALLGFEADGQARQFCDFYDLSISASSEAGEEVDVKSWSEDNVREKRPMAQSFDPSLDALIDEVEVMKPLEGGTSIGNGAQSGPISHMLNQQKPKFNVTAPPFEPKRSSSSSEPSALRTTAAVPSLGASHSPMPSFSFGGNGATAPTGPTPKSSSATGSSAGPSFKADAVSSRVTSSAREPLAGSFAAPQPAAAPSAAAPPAVAAATPPQSKPQKPPVPESTIRAIFDMGVKDEAQKLIERAKLTVQRSRFVDSVARGLLQALLTTVSARDSSMIARAVSYDRERLQRYALRAIKRTASEALDLQHEKERQAQELQLFWSRAPKRVVSQRRTLTPVALASPPPKPAETADASAEAHPKESSMQIDEPEEEEEEEVEPFSFLPLIPLLRKAYSSGLTRLTVLVEKSSGQGLWLHRVLGSGDVPVEVLPGRFVIVCVLGPGAPPHSDVCLYGEGSTESQVPVARNISSVKSLMGLERAFSSALRDWLLWRENALLHYRSLNVVNAKRRRVSHPSSGFLAPPSESSQSSLSLAQQHSYAAHTNERVRLRALIADARSLMK